MDIKVNPKIVEHIQLVDIRTPFEWKKTGVVKKSLLLSFFDDYGNYNLDEFIADLASKFDMSKEIGILCRSGGRSSFVTYQLRQIGIDAINLQGGILSLLRQGYQTEKI